MARGFRDGLIAGVFIVGVQIVYRLYPAYFPPMMLFAAVALLFYRKLDRIEAVLSEERRRDAFRHRRTAGPQALVLLVVAGVIGLAGWYVVWNLIVPVG